MTTWIWLSRRKGREALYMSLEHIRHVIRVVEGLMDMIKCLERGDREKAMELYKRVYHEEEEADVKKRDIIRALSGGVLHPIDREDIIRLVLTSDDIAAHAKAAARRIKMLLDTGLSIPPSVISVLSRMMDKSVEAVRLLENAVSSLISEPKRSLEDADVIERLEEEVDDLKMNAYEEEIRHCSSTWSVECIVVKEIIDNVEMITDKCEDTGDVVRSIALMSL